MNIIDTSPALLSAYAEGRFDLELWKAYMDTAVPGAKDLCLEDLRQCLNAGYGWESDFLPVLNAVYRCEAQREAAIRSSAVSAWV